MWEDLLFLCIHSHSMMLHVYSYDQCSQIAWAMVPIASYSPSVSQLASFSQLPILRIWMISGIVCTQLWVGEEKIMLLVVKENVWHLWPIFEGYSSPWINAIWGDGYRLYTTFFFPKMWLRMPEKSQLLKEKWKHSSSVEDNGGAGGLCGFIRG